MEEKVRFYKVVCMCGHVGKRRYIPIAFAIKAKGGKNAAKIARGLPRVKCQRRDAVLSCEEISEEQYRELRRINKEDPYLSCGNVQDQMEHPEIAERIIEIEGSTRRHKKEKEPLSEKYLYWKRVGRYEII